MKVMIIGDVVGSMGCDFVRSKMPLLKKQYAPDFIIANGENSAQGNGILPHSANHLFDSGIDVITSGNHALRRREIYEMFDSDVALIRPANFHHTAPGRGVYIVDMLKYKVAVVNLIGRAYLEPNGNPFEYIDDILKDLDTPNIIVDFHAEATAEKVAMGFYLDGRVSLVVGTHTHVQTADARVLPNHTGYITDVGMCGGLNSVLGVKSELAIRRLKTGIPTQFKNDDGLQMLNGIIADIDENNGKCMDITSFMV